MNLSKHFTLAEMTKSETAEREGIVNIPPPEVIPSAERLAQDILDPIRERWGRCVITSGYRCSELNSHPSVNGSATSDHIWGDDAASVDFIPAEAPKMGEVFDWIRLESKLIFDQCFLEYKLIDGKRHNRCIHISWRAVSPRRQAGHKPTGGYGKIEWKEVA